MSLRIGDDEDLPVGEDTVYVEDQDFYVFGAGFSGHSTMIPRGEEDTLAGNSTVPPRF
jgi:hypothetical protein